MKKKILSVFIIFYLLALLVSIGATVFVLQTNARRNDVIRAQNRIIEMATAEQDHMEEIHAMGMYLYVQDDGKASFVSNTPCSVQQWLINTHDAGVEGDSIYAEKLAEISAIHSAMHDGIAQAVALKEAGSVLAAQVFFEDELQPASREMTVLMEEVIDLAWGEVQALTAASERAFTVVFSVFVGVLAASAIVFLWMSTRLVRQVVPPLNKLTVAAENMAQGNLELDFDIGDHENDELGQLVNAMRAMTENIRKQAEVAAEIADGNFNVTLPVRSEHDVINQAVNTMVAQNNAVISNVHSASEQVAHGSEQIAAGAQMLASGSTEQAALIQQLTAAILQIQQQAEENSTLAAQTFETTDITNRLMHEGLMQMQDTIDAMRAIENSSGTIARVIKVIDDIAFQTNILSLNAAVEAARAGQHGKGFAVVADEVRNLAAKSATAAQETAALVEESVRNAGIGSEVVVKTSKRLEEAGDIAQNNMEMMRRLGELSKKQSDAIFEITKSLEQISAVVQANSANAEESAAAAEEISSQSSFLNQVVSKFKLQSDDETEG
ncbi:methyl-accepting chemotaxis protein [Christensenellaceae bacterium OttesenSCG-928-L17]|nr:methyl-accepting chemotaxis protein [Christensenellaceae bacterium OttesenSCG-928-L17]